MSFTASMVEVRFKVSYIGLSRIPKDLGLPPIAISPSKVSPGDLLEGMCNVNGFQDWQVSEIFVRLVAQVFNKWRERKSPFIGANGDKKRKGKQTVSKCQ